MSLFHCDKCGEPWSSHENCDDVARPVYVDQPFTAVARGSQAHRVGQRHGHRWSHMWSDDVEALSIDWLAASVCGERGFQAKPGFPHYDLVPTIRAKALACGAVERDLIDWVREKRKKQANP